VAICTYMETLSISRSRGEGSLLDLHIHVWAARLAHVSCRLPRLGRIKAVCRNFFADITSDRAGCQPLGPLRCPLYSFACPGAELGGTHRRCGHRPSARRACRRDSSRAGLVRACGARWHLPTRPGAVDLAMLSWQAATTSCQFGLLVWLAWSPRAREAWSLQPCSM
jgi:hypothetical protein